MAAQRTSIPRPPRSRTDKPARSTAKDPTSKDDSRKVALLAAEAGLEKKATAIEIVDVSGKVDYADYLVLMTGASDRNVAAIAHEVDAHLGKQGVKSISVEGLPQAHWVLIDFVDVVVHVFQRDVRSLYDLDGLWMDAQRVPVPSAAKAAVPKAAAPKATAAAKPAAKPAASKVSASKSATPKTAASKSKATRGSD
ncbi:MAG TPA: ribosome silencing factor [Polyangiaceae bacterium]|nr:ribosome silencing factor [Polyangiaceae bacterium]